MSKSAAQALARVVGQPMRTQAAQQRRHSGRVQAAGPSRMCDRVNKGTCQVSSPAGSAGGVLCRLSKLGFPEAASTDVLMSGNKMHA